MSDFTELEKLQEELLVIKRKIELATEWRKRITNHKDETANRGLTLTESKIKALTKHYKKTGKLASEWKFDPERAGFYTK